MTAPDQLYLEQWPERANRDDRIFYEPTGYGEDGNGNASTITVYVKESLAERPTPQTARVAFKSWALEAQHGFLAELLAEHAYAAGAQNAPFPFPDRSDERALLSDWELGLADYSARKRQTEAGERGELSLADSTGTVTWDFSEDDLDLDDEQLAARRSTRERLCSEPVVEVAAMEGESSGDNGEPYWYAIYLRERAANGELAVEVGTIQCMSGRPTEQAIVAALSRWRAGPEYRVTKTVASGGEDAPE
jgi:hypothetical protein